MLSIVLPCFNEIKSLEYVVDIWHKHLIKIGTDHEFVICEDGSTDGTKELIDELILKYPINDQRVERRRGYGSAVIDGINNSNGDLILCIDSDGQCLPDDYLNLYSLLIKKDSKKRDFVMGHRYPRKDPIHRKIYSFMFGAYHKILFPNNLKDPSCPYVLGFKEKWQSVDKLLIYLKEGFWWGFVGACKKKGLNIEDVKIKHHERYDGSTQVYKTSKIPSIAFRNCLSLLRLKLAK